MVVLRDPSDTYLTICDLALSITIYKCNLENFPICLELTATLLAH